MDLEILNYNADSNSCNYRCFECSRYFDCNYNLKEQTLQKYWVYKSNKKCLADVKYKIMVLSGKGGVGKSTVSANLAAELRARGNATGVMDLDLMGPSIPRLLGVSDKKMFLRLGEGILPVINEQGIKVMSMAHTLRDDEALTWFHNMKRSAVEGFLTQILYGELNYLIIDLPPGTGTETSSVIRYLNENSGAVIVTIPTDVSHKVARKPVELCRKAGIPILGVIENMSGYACPHCGKISDVLCASGGRQMAEELDIPYLGRIPLEEIASQDSDTGKPFVINHPESTAARCFKDIVDKILVNTQREE